MRRERDEAMRGRGTGLWLAVVAVALSGMALEGCGKKKFRRAAAVVPEITSVTPDTGPTTGGTAITIGVGTPAAFNLLTHSHLTAMGPSGPPTPGS